MLARKALAGTAGAPKVYVEDVFSTYLYTGNSTSGGTQTITNNIDLSTEGGLVWIKGRSAASNHILTDTARGAGASATNNNALASNLITAEDLGGSSYDYLSSFSTTGFVVTQGGTTTATRGTNYNAVTYASWTFRKAKKFFDIVKYTGTGSTKTVSHNLGSTPGCMIVKRLGSAENWAVWHRGLSAGYWIELNNTGAQTNAASADIFGNGTTYVDPTSTVFTVGSENRVNDVGSDYIAYLFAHDAGGFGDAGSDSIIKCGSYTTDGSGNATIDLGWEPQWVLIKPSSAVGDWRLWDNMRPFTTTSASYLEPNTSDAEADNSYWFQLRSNGFYSERSASTTYIYIAIRRGPMKKPTSGTSVFKAMYGTGGTPSFTSTFPVDMIMDGTVASAWDGYIGSRLQGGNLMYTNLTNTETSSFSVNVKYDYSYGWGTSAFDSTHFSYLFSRAPGFFDVVCYTGTGANATVSHNLGVAPELMIVKRRSTTSTDWAVYSNNDNTDYLVLNTTAATVDDNTYWNDTSPTSSVFSVGTNNATNASGNTYVAYLFASLSGVSKVGSYTGNGSSVTVTTDFQPRFIMVKRVDSTGDWIVSDSTRGLVAGNDPYLRLNSSAAQVTNEDWVDISSTSFTVNQTTNNANVNTGTYIYLAIA